MVKIKDMVVGSTVSTTLLVKSADIKMTKANKPYLFMVLTDGSDDVQAQDWDFGNGTPPSKNSIIDVSGSVTEWSGNKQIKLSSFSYNAEYGPELFAPTWDFSINDYVAKCNELRESIGNPHIKDIVDRAFKDNAKLWKSVPAAKGIHHAWVGGNLKHSVDVAIKALALAETMPMCNKDLCIAGGLLQDLGKLWTYEFNGAIIEMTEIGQLIEHITLGITKLEAYRTPENTRIVDILQHLISSHHGKQEYGSPTTPMFLEAWVVHCADLLDSRAQIIYELNAKATGTYTDRSYALENRAMFTQNYIHSLLGGE